MENRKSLPNFRIDPGLEIVEQKLLTRRNTYAHEKDIDSAKDLVGSGKNVDGALDFRFIGLMFVTQLVMKWVQHLTTAGEAFIWMGYHVPAPTMQVYMAITSLPGVLKPLLGLISDACPILGYTKTPYALILSTTGLIGLFLIGTSPSSPQGGGGMMEMMSGMMSGEMKKPADPTLSIPTLLASCFFIQLMYGMCTVFTSGLLAEKMNTFLDTEEKGSQSKSVKLMTLFLVIGMVANLGSGFVSGRVLQDVGAPKLYYIGGFMALLLPFWILAFGFGETKMTPEQLSRVRGFLSKQREVVGLTILLSASCLFMIFVPLAAGNSVLVNFIVALVTSVVVITTFFVLLTPVLAKTLLGFFLFSAMNFNVMGAMMYFLIDNKYQNPGGPNLTKMFISFWNPLVSTLCGLLGCAVYKHFGVPMPIRRWEIITGLFMAPSLLLPVFWVWRWNLQWGISDQAWCLIESGVQAFFMALQCMPFSFALPRLCPNGLESAMMQLLTGCVFMGALVSEDLGAVVLQVLDVHPAGNLFEQDTFKNLKWVHVIKCSVAILSMFVAIPLLPNACVGDKLIQNERPDAATFGSIWNTWRKKKNTAANAAAPNYGSLSA